MNLDLYREVSTQRGTLGRLAIDGVFECWTLEDIVREGPKLAHETAIPAGVYRVTITYSPHFQRMLPVVHDVPDFDGIRFHAGNTAEDTSGCILVGQERDAHSIYRSRLALEKLQAKVADAIARGREVWLYIHAAFPAETFRV